MKNIVKKEIMKYINSLKKWKVAVLFIFWTCSKKRSAVEFFSEHCHQLSCTTVLHNRLAINLEKWLTSLQPGWDACGDSPRNLGIAVDGSERPGLSGDHICHHRPSSAIICHHLNHQGVVRSTEAPLRVEDGISLPFLAQDIGWQKSESETHIWHFDSTKVKSARDMVT